MINPGVLGTPEVLADIQEGRTPAQPLIPLRDICSLIDWLLSLAPSTEVGEVDLRPK